MRPACKSLAARHRRADARGVFTEELSHAPDGLQLLPRAVCEVRWGSSMGEELLPVIAASGNVIEERGVGPVSDRIEGKPLSRANHLQRQLLPVLGCARANLKGARDPSLGEAKLSLHQGMSDLRMWSLRNSSEPRRGGGEAAARIEHSCDVQEVHEHVEVDVLVWALSV